MPDQYHFSTGERSKFFRPNAELRLPIYMNAQVAYLTERAAEKSVPLGEMVNALLKQDIQIIEPKKREFDTVEDPMYGVLLACWPTFSLPLPQAQ